MKRAITIVVLFVLLIVLATYELVMVDKIITKLDNLTLTIQTEIKNNKDNITVATNSITETKSFWDKHEDNLCLMFNHKDLSTITDTLSRLLSYAENNDYDNAIVEANLLKEYSEKNRHIMGFNMQNFL